MQKKYSSLHPHGECKMYSLFLPFFPNLSVILMNLLKICSRATLLVFLFLFLLKIREQISVVAVGNKTNRKFQNIVKALLNCDMARRSTLKTADFWRNVCQEAVLCRCRVSGNKVLQTEALTAFVLGCLFKGLSAD